MKTRARAQSMTELMVGLIALPAKPFGGQVDGEVTVQTSVTVHPFLVSAIVPQGVELKAKGIGATSRYWTGLEFGLLWSGRVRRLGNSS